MKADKEFKLFDDRLLSSPVSTIFFPLLKLCHQESCSAVTMNLPNRQICEFVIYQIEKQARNSLKPIRVSLCPQ